MRRSALAALLALAACSGKPALDDPALSDRTLDLEAFFDGPVTASGQFQDVFGAVRRRFDVDIASRWDGQTLTLTEDFTYDDGSTERRVWTLVKTGPETWEGTAPGVLGIARGTESGDAFNWRYTIDLPVGEGTLRATFNDWMWLMSDRTLLNRAYMSRSGVPLGEVIIWFEKAAP
ncbi:DUF3833 domain-containing protein [Meridianimarinicoccus roseus]|uniref:DUF3833 domain-containing protein n=1 Tax=Meridianimarinicoccus roseus TaxID=2072018 RepID=A0A2V2LJE0_9RHOB|nr:DUF3833 domain-containing protein [Meridianimarinicoccus roseus]PWR03604.1 DUF3833 domain-containing protein [Meridianimarinicoccus roseus]